MPAIFHNSTAADSSTNTAARPASASPLRPPPRAPSAWPRPRGPRLHGCPSGVHLSASSRDVLCLSSRHMWPLSSAVSVLSAPTSGPNSVCHFPGTPPPTICPAVFSIPSSQVRLSGSYLTPIQVYTLAACFPSACVAVCLSHHLQGMEWGMGGGGARMLSAPAPPADSIASALDPLGDP